MTDADELVETLSRRHGILRALHRAPRERHELVDELEDAKSTVYKGVSQLLETGLIHRTDDGLRPTLLGSVALRRYEELARTSELSPVLTDLSSEAIDPLVFVECEFVSPDTGSVDRHLERAQHLLKTARDVRGVVPVASTTNVEMVRSRVTEEELSAEFVLSGALTDTLRSEQADVVASLLENDVTLWRTENPIPFGVFVIRAAETRRMAVEFREGNLVTGLLLNDTAGSIDWAEERISTYKADAVRVVRE